MQVRYCYTTVLTCRILADGLSRILEAHGNHHQAIDIFGCPALPFAKATLLANPMSLPNIDVDSENNPLALTLLLYMLLTILV